MAVHKGGDEIASRVNVPVLLNLHGGHYVLESLELLNFLICDCLTTIQGKNGYVPSVSSCAYEI